MTQRHVELVGFTDRQARMIYDAVTAIVPIMSPLRGRQRRSRR